VAQGRVRLIIDVSGEFNNHDEDVVGLSPVERWGDGLLAQVENALMQRCTVEATNLVVLT